ncbi:cytochrome P450 2C19-like [Brienomyrus brachyistius]|uniref:cytochrome P450 2C19-like n=1 Tax=Brienomyrus brachyistius TaxID=42636 RepID=UPI0020B1F28D|nr:cytochrome P450 2C19-like [Brienomyrus brachyistius]
MEISTTLVLAGLVLVLVLLLSWGWNRKDVNLPPGPKPLPLLGNLMQLDRTAPFKSILELSKSYGPVMTVYIGPQRQVVLVGYETVKEALVDQAEDFTDRAPLPILQKITQGYGLVISNGDRWRQLRRFTLSTLRDFGMGQKRMEEWIQEESKHLVDSLASTNSAPCNPTFILSQAVSNVICSLVFGQRFEYKDHTFLRLLSITNQTLQFISSPWGQFCNTFPWLMDHLPGRHNKILADVEELKASAEQKIHKHQETLTPDYPRDFIDCFLTRLKQEKDNPSSEFHYNNMIFTVINLFLAGTETTSTTLRYALMLLIKHPDIQERVQIEIDTVIGRDRCPMMEDRKSLPFTNAVIHEVQRFLDILPFSLPHYATRDISFRGYTIPKGTFIIPFLHSVLRDASQWASPWDFKPEHFLDHDGNFKKNPAFMVFSAGKRSCVGESLARMELFLFLVSILQHFTFSCPGGPDSLDPTPEYSSFGRLPRQYQLIATPR